MILIALVVTGTGYVAKSRWDATRALDERTGAGGVAKAKGQSINVLLLGSDDGRMDGNTDTIMAVNVDPARQTISLMSIPRDSRVNIDRHGMNKINAANPLGGPRLTVATVEKLIGERIDFYVLLDFKAAGRIIDKLGGVTLDVPMRMYYHDPYQNLRIDLLPGKQHLNGQQAINFARFRGDGRGDIGRTERQQRLIQEMGRQLLASATIEKLPGLVPEFFRSVRTNASPAEAVRMASLFRTNRSWELVTMTLPGNFQDIEGISYWGVDQEKARQAWAALLEGRITPLLDPALARWDTSKRPIMPAVYDLTYTVDGAESIPKVVYAPWESGPDETPPNDGVAPTEPAAPRGEPDPGGEPTPEPKTGAGTGTGSAAGTDTKTPTPTPTPPPPPADTTIPSYLYDPSPSP